MLSPRVAAPWWSRSRLAWRRTRRPRRPANPSIAAPRRGALVHSPTAPSGGVSAARPRARTAGGMWGGRAMDRRIRASSVRWRTRATPTAAVPTPAFSARSEPRDHLGLDGLELGVADEPVGQHLLRRLEPLDRIGATRGALAACHSP